MTESKEIKKAKIDLLFEGFTNKGYNSNDKLDQKKLIEYLNDRSNIDKFDKVLSDKLFQILSLDSENSISIEDFISGYLQFEEDIKKKCERIK